LFPFGSDLDENLQNAFLKYLEIRGIKPGVTNVLFDYMANKDTKEYLLWLKNVKNFVEK
jgi:complement component 1 Q subcomponent-binding protein